MLIVEKSFAYFVVRANISNPRHLTQDRKGVIVFEAPKTDFLHKYMSVA